MQTLSRPEVNRAGELAHWVGPFRIGELLYRCLDYDLQEWPPDTNGVYLVSRESWHGAPTRECVPLYVGGNTGRPGRFVTRVGDLIADLFGFFTDATGHHSGGGRLHTEFCRAYVV